MRVRLTPDRKPTTVTSIPRDLLVDGEKINAAYARSGAGGGRMARRSLRVDRSLRERRQLFRFAELGIHGAAKPVRNVPFPVRPAPGHENSFVASRAMRRRTVEAFLGEAKSAPAASKPRRGGPGRATKGPALVSARPAGENLAIVSAPRLDFPFYFPARLTKTAAYVDDPVRTYKLRDTEGREHDAYRLVLSTDRVGQYVGVQGTSWRGPPILGDEPSRTVRRRGRTLLVYADGGRTRMVAWRTRGAVYWVSNSLSRTLSEGELTGIAASLSRFGR